MRTRTQWLIGLVVVVLATPAVAGGKRPFKTVQERSDEYDASVQLLVVEKFPDKINLNGRIIHGKPKVVVFKRGGVGEELARETWSEDGLVEELTGAVPNGPVRMYFTAMQVERELFYQDNRREGSDTSFDRGGKVTREVQWVAGKREGLWSFREDDTGALYREETWKGGVRQLVKTYWNDTTGELRTQQKFKNGEPGPLEYFDQRGKPTTKQKWALDDDPELGKQSGPKVNPGKAGNGERCSGNDRCVSGNCTRDNRCAARPGFRRDLASGQQCLRDTWCSSGVCGPSNHCN